MRSPKLPFYIAGFAFAFLIMALSFVFTDTASAATSRVAQVEKVTGDVTVRKAGGSKSFVAYRNMHLNEGDHLTTGANSSVVLKVLDVEDEIIVGEKSKLYIGDLKEEAGKKKSSAKVWFGSLWTKANPSGSDDAELEIETPTAVMGVRGTQFQVVVDPETGRETLFVLDGVVSASPRTNGETTGTDEQEELIYPGQQISIIPDLDEEVDGMDSILTMMDAERLVEHLDQTIIEALLRNKQNIDQENEEWLQQLREQMDENVLRDLLSIEDLEMYQTQLGQLLDVLISNAIKQGKVTRAEVQDLIRRVQSETNQDIEVDLDKEALDMTDRQKQQLDRLREMEQKRQEQLEREQQRRDEAAEQNRDLLNRLEQQRRQLEERNRQAAEEKKRQTEEQFLENLQDEERRQLEERLQQREQERRDQQRRSELPEFPVYTGGGGSGKGPGGGDDDDDNSSSNTPPAAKSDIDQSLTIDQEITLSPADVATDEDGDDLSFTSVRSADETIVAVQLGGGNLHLHAKREGTVEVIVDVTDGTDVIELQFVVIVTADAPSNHAPKAKDNLNISIPLGVGITLLPEDLATDEDGDDLSFVRARSTDETIVVVQLAGSYMHLYTEREGTVEVIVEVTDGTDVIELQFVVIVTADAPLNRAPEAKEDLDISIPLGVGITLLPEDLATDADGDELNFVGATSSDEDIVLPIIDDGGLNLNAISPGTVEVSVEVTDGTETVAVIISVTVAASENHIYGRIMTPEPAAAGGIPIKIYAEDAEGVGFDTLMTQVIVPEGKTEVYYHIEVPEEMMEALFYISYEIDQAFAGRYIPTGIYGEEIGGMFEPLAVQVGKSIDFNLVKGNVISGKINIPQPAPAGGEEIVIVVEQELCNDEQSCEPGNVLTWEYVGFIPEGEQSIPYQLLLPPAENYQILFGYNDQGSLFGEIDYAYLDVEQLKEMLVGEGVPTEELNFPDYWLEAGQVAIWSVMKEIATRLDLSAGDQTGIDLNFPGVMPEYELIAKNDMILVTLDPENEKGYADVISILDAEHSFEGRNFVITDLVPNESYSLRLIGIDDGLPVPITDIKQTMVTSSEPGLEIIKVSPANMLNVSWYAYEGATRHAVYLYRQGDVISDQFTESPEGVTILTVNNRMDATIPLPGGNTDYIIRIEATNQQGTLLAATTLLIEN